MPEALTIADLIQLIYSSQPFGYDESILEGVLFDARRCNTRDGITGALICRRDIYLQFLEGPQNAVEAAYARILRDDRHLDIRLRASGPVESRIFGDWAMLHDPATSWIFTPDQIAEGALDRTTASDLQGLFRSLAAKATGRE